MRAACTLISILLLSSWAGLSAKSLEEYSTETNALIQARQWSSLESLMRQGIGEYPDREWMHANLNYALREQKRYDEALRQARAMRDKWPASDRSASTLARALTAAAAGLYQEGNYKESLPLAKEAIQLNESESGYVWAGNALRKLGRLKEAVEIQEKGLEKHPTNPWLKPNLAITYAAWAKEAEESGDYDSAVIRFEKAWKLDSAQEYILFGLGRSLRSAGKFEKAIETFKSGMSRFKDADHFKRAVGYTHLLRLRSTIDKASNKEIESLARKALEESSNFNSFEEAQYLVTTIGEAYTHTGNIEGLRSALEVFEKNIEDPIPLWDFYGRQIYILARIKGPVSAEVKEESLRYRRKAMSRYEAKNSPRPTISDLSLPLKNRFVVWAEFDGDYMTHTGFAKYCYDFSRVDERGNPLRPGGKRLRAGDYWMFGEPVYSMTKGTVTSIVNDQPDNNNGSYGRQGNSVVVKTEQGSFAFYTHFKQGSIRVKEGQSVSTDTILGEAGNSGMSTEPHLHVCMYDESWVSLPFRFRPVRVMDGSVTKKTSEPLQKDWIVEGH